MNAVAIVSVAALVRLVFAALIPAFPDETYYWDWSRHLAAGYFDHPPGIALLIRLGAVPLAPLRADATPLGLRFGVIVAGWVAAMATAAIARRLRGESGATRAATIISVMPLAAAGLILATPDVPVLMGTALTLYGVTRALEHEPHSRDSLRWWTVSGVALGIAFCSKYTSIFLPIGVVIAILVRPSLRGRLREPGPYAACVIATIMFLPVLLWNRQHEWISFVFQVRHGLAAPGGSALVAAWKHEGDFWGGQAALASPILFVIMGIAVVKAARRRSAQDDRTFVLAVVALVAFGFFVYSALRQRVEPNWPSPAYIPAIVLLATTHREHVGRRWVHAGILVAAAMSAIIYLQAIVPILPIPPRKDPIARAFGWRDLAAAADLAAGSAHIETDRPTWLGGDRYQEASEMAFHAPSHPTTFATNLSGRVNQYDLWPRFPDRARHGDNLVLALDESNARPDVINALAPYFQSVARGAPVTLERGHAEIGTRRLWTLIGWRGGWPNPTR